MKLHSRDCFCLGKLFPVPQEILYITCKESPYSEYTYWYFLSYLHSCIWFAVERALHVIVCNWPHMGSSNRVARRVGKGTHFQPHHIAGWNANSKSTYISKTKLDGSVYGIYMKVPICLLSLFMCFAAALNLVYDPNILPKQTQKQCPTM